MHEHHDKQLINTERTWRFILCLNTKHELIRFRTNEIGNLECPLCRELMITEIVSPININNIINLENS